MKGFLKQISRSNGGIPKWAVSGPVALTEAGVEGDRQRDLRFHGGPEKAVLMIAAMVIDNLAAQGCRVCPGALGENLTVAGLDPHEWRSGQRWSIGSGPVIELTTLRVPCSHLHIYGLTVGRQLYDSACKAGDPSSPAWAHGGFYARVVRPGLLEDGASVTLLSDNA